MKNVVITGSTRGIGLGLAKAFLEKGCCVTINGCSEKSVTHALTQLSEYKDRINALAGNITSLDTIKALFNTSVSKFGSVDIWVNNAGISQRNMFSWELDYEEISSVLDVNVKALMSATIHVFKKMQTQGHGKIFNMEGFGSDGRITEKLSVYGTSKRAVQYFTKAIAQEAKSSKVQIGVISPGMVVTDLLKLTLNGSSDEVNSRKKIYNILGDTVDTVSSFLSEGMLKSHKNYDRIIWLTSGKAMRRFMKSMFVKRNIFED